MIILALSGTQPIKGSKLVNIGPKFIFYRKSEMPNIENYGQYQDQDQDQYQVDFFLPILGLVLGLAPKKVPNILEIVLEKGLGFVFFKTSYNYNKYKTVEQKKSHL